MASVNKVILIGNLGRDPEFRVTPSGRPVANFSMATTERWTSKDGEKQEKTEWHRVVFWGRQAEVVNQYLKKGSSCYVEGSLATRSWEDKDKIKRYTTEVEGRVLQLLSSRDGGGGYAAPPTPPDEYYDSYPDSTGGGGSQGSAPSGDGGGSGGTDDDLPF